MFLGATIAVGYERTWWSGSLGGALFGIAVGGLEIALKNFSFRGFSHATVGMLVGVLCAWIVTRIGIFQTKGLEDYQGARTIFELIVYMGLGFLGMMLALRSNKEEFSLLIPYVRFRQDSVRSYPMLVDANVLIDGRIPRICATGFLAGSLVVPRFVIDELHRMADADDDIRRERGRRGLECLQQMRTSPSLEVTIQEHADDEDAPVDTRLVSLARLLGARILTNDVNLGKVARLQGINSLNLNELAQALRPVVAPGDELRLSLIKEGKDPGQAVGYLPDGTMIVVNHAKSMIGTTQDVVVGGALQTSAGRLFFADLKGRESAAAARP